MLISKPKVPVVSTFDELVGLGRQSGTQEGRPMLDLKGNVIHKEASDPASMITAVSIETSTGLEEHELLAAIRGSITLCECAYVNKYSRIRRLAPTHARDSQVARSGADAVSALIDTDGIDPQSPGSEPAPKVNQGVEAFWRNK
ncbi:hypothetical protein MGG_18127 [Pyricularia oryzae 70-15]|uniref:Uncharacterized protein n=1 Tax=Pyricularia oryzae (strain 70-15 / ATCC MYA-4617 / FGSC 8958) TaxID=242507 RepID=A0A151V4N9_PYRO7|nr:uncharacterized protein MGG_18127 [Pyricularia oryzae 70-15]KYQ30553.1 hypothetical protein MGG_18127 [Pyricularia oryzae 70-15]